MPAATREPEASRDASPTHAPRVAPWTCPFCALHCDGLGVTVGPQLGLEGSDCPLARARLAGFGVTPASATPAIAGKSVALADALDAAAALLAAARQPLFGGLATDVAGVRAAFALAEATGAIVDHLHGTAIMHGVRAIQDRGVYYTTLAEIRAHADLLVCCGTKPSEHYPEFFRRCGVEGELGPSAPARRVVFLGTECDPRLANAAAVAVQEIACEGEDLYATLARLAAHVAARPVERSAAGPALEGLAAALRSARYAVLVWEPGRLDVHGALAAERINTIVAALNGSTRAASFALGGSDGAYTANQAITWLSGLPLRTGAHRHGLVHEPACYATERLLRDGSVDALLWISSFGPQPLPERAPSAQVVLGHPALASTAPVQGERCVFFPVSTPGIGSRGHLFRMDGGIALPMRPVYADTLPGVAQVLEGIRARLPLREPAARVESAAR